MGTICLNIKDESKQELLFDFLKTLEYVEVLPAAEEPPAKADPHALFGMWKDRDISLETIRENRESSRGSGLETQHF